MSSVDRTTCINKTTNIRDLILTALSAEVRQRHEPLYCLDAFDSSGKSGWCWKEILKDQVHVTIADREINNDSVSSNKVERLSFRDFPLDVSRVPGDPIVPQKINEIFLAKCAADLILHMESFDFVNLNPHYNLVSCVESAVINLKHKGILCVSATDISSKFARSPQVIRRQFGASVIKTSYMKELAIRIVLANIARSCAKYNKGINVLMSVCEQDHFLIIVRILRGVKDSDRCMEKIVPVLHCQFCEERVFYPNSLSPQEEPYKLLPCTCNSENPGKTAVILGPVWSGELYNMSFIDAMLHVVKDMNWSTADQLNLLMEEATCSNHSNSENQEPDQKRMKLSTPTILSNHEVSMIPFYHNLHNMKLKRVELPKFGRLLEVLRLEGYSASRTHLDHYSVRTNATVKQLTDIIYRHCKKTS